MERRRRSHEHFQGGICVHEVHVILSHARELLGIHAFHSFWRKISHQDDWKPRAATLPVLRAQQISTPRPVRRVQNSGCLHPSLCLPN